MGNPLMNAIKQHCGETMWQLLLIFSIAISATTVVYVYICYALPIVARTPKPVNEHLITIIGQL